MPIPWPVIFKAIPWSELVVAAPKVLDQAKKLVAAARRTESGSTDLAEPAATAGLQGNPLPDIEARLSSLEERIEEMAREAISSAELSKSLAEQNAQLVQALQNVRRLIVFVIAISCAAWGLALWRVLS